VVNAPEWSRVVGIVVVGTLVACAGDDRGQPMTLDEFESDIEDAICGGDGARCCTTNGGTYSETTCHQSIFLADAAQTNVGAFFPKAKGTFNPGAAADCISWIRTRMQTCSLNVNALDVSCTVFFTADYVVGQSCSSPTLSLACAQPAGQRVQCNGSCVAYPIVGPGQSCASGAICSPAGSQVCRPDSMTCASPGGAGAACGSAKDCGTEADCCVAGVCARRAGEGQPCSGECMAGVVKGNCARGLACMSGVCVSAARIGEACGNGVQCEGGATCSSSSMSGAGTCLPALGQLGCGY
jgi:hypothetical protein